MAFLELHPQRLAGMVAGGVPVKRSTKSYSERELIEAVLAARRALGPEMSRAQYTRDARLAVYDGANWLRAGKLGLAPADHDADPIGIDRKEVA